jgi:hypothetical protein
MLKVANYFQRDNYNHMPQGRLKIFVIPRVSLTAMIHIKTLLRSKTFGSFKSRSFYELLVNRRRVIRRKPVSQLNLQNDAIANAITYHAVLKNGRLSMS